MSSCLGEPAFLHSNSSHSENKVRSIKFETIDHVKFRNIVEQHKRPLLLNDVYQDISSVCNGLYDLARESQAHQRVCGGAGASSGRWDRLLESGDEARVWRAVDWSGKLSDDAAPIHSTPDFEFKQHFE